MPAIVGPACQLWFKIYVPREVPLLGFQVELAQLGHRNNPNRSVQHIYCHEDSIFGYLSGLSFGGVDDDRAFKWRYVNLLFGTPSCELWSSSIRDSWSPGL